MVLPGVERENVTMRGRAQEKMGESVRELKKEREGDGEKRGTE